MALSSEERLEQLKEIYNDLKSIINKEYSKEGGYACAFVFNNLFEECWKLMRELLYSYYGYGADSSETKGPRNIISTSYEVGIIESERWIKMLLDRNNSTHDYRSQNMEYYFEQIKKEYSVLIKEFIKRSGSIIEKSSDK